MEPSVFRMAPCVYEKKLMCFPVCHQAHNQGESNAHRPDGHLAPLHSGLMSCFPYTRLYIFYSSGEISWCQDPYYSYIPCLFGKDYTIMRDVHCLLISHSSPATIVFRLVWGKPYTYSLSVTTHPYHLGSWVSQPISAVLGWSWRFTIWTSCQFIIEPK